MRKDLEWKNLQINGLETKLEHLENNHHSQRKERDKRIKELEKIIKCRDSKFKCKQCEYTTGSEQGLKTHISKKHKPTAESLDFPRSCHLCDKNLQSLKEYKIHIKTHSYRLIQYQCNMCSFSEYNEVGIEVHVGREHGENFECGMCEFIAEDLESLDLHLLTCEIYKCNKCEIVFKTYKILSNTLLKMKHIKVQHIQNKAEKISTVMMQSVIHLINCSKFKFTTNLHHRHFTPQNFNKFTTQALYTKKFQEIFTITHNSMKVKVKAEL